jgi:hypothetical protein
MRRSLAQHLSAVTGPKYLAVILAVSYLSAIRQSIAEGGITDYGVLN